MTTARPSVPEGLPADRDGLLRFIERQRVELASTVDALSGKLDVKTRATRGIKSLVGDLRTTAKQRPEVLAGAGVAVLAALLLIRKVTR